ncbi:hypothetical protein L9F63_002593, partial [Diploptera punctata]
YVKYIVECCTVYYSDRKKRAQMCITCGLCCMPAMILLCWRVCSMSANIVLMIFMPIKIETHRVIPVNIGTRGESDQIKSTRLQLMPSSRKV